MQGLCHPTLFNRFEQKDAVLKYGHFYIDPVLAPNGLQPDRADFQLHIPIPSRMQIAEDLQYTEFAEEDLRDDVLLIGIPRRFINQVFPDDRMEMMAMVEKIRMVMRSNDSVVHANSRTVGASLAANLLNLLFKSLFIAANITSSEAKSQFLTALKTSDSAPLRTLIHQSVPGAMVCCTLFMSKSQL